MRRAVGNADGCFEMPRGIVATVAFLFYDGTPCMTGHTRHVEAGGGRMPRF